MKKVEWFLAALRESAIAVGGVLMSIVALYVGYTSVISETTKGVTKWVSITLCVIVVCAVALVMAIAGTVFCIAIFAVLAGWCACVLIRVAAKAVCSYCEDLCKDLDKMGDLMFYMPRW